MSAALKCDKCGKFFECYDEHGKELTRISISINYEDATMRGGRRYDICPECAEAFNVWIKEKRNDK